VEVFEDVGDRYCVFKVLAVTHIQTGVIVAPMPGQTLKKLCPNSTRRAADIHRKRPAAPR